MVKSHIDYTHTHSPETVEDIGSWGRIGGVHISLNISDWWTETTYRYYEQQQFAVCPLWNEKKEKVDLHHFVTATRRSRVRIPLKPWFFFRLLLSNCVNWKIYCDDHSSLSSTTAVQIWIISYTSHPLWKLSASQKFEAMVKHIRTLMKIILI